MRVLAISQTAKTNEQRFQQNQNLSQSILTADKFESLNSSSQISFKKKLPVGKFFKALAEQTAALKEKAALALSPNKRWKAEWAAEVKKGKEEFAAALGNIKKPNGTPFFSEKDTSLLLKSRAMYQADIAIELIEALKKVVDKKEKKLLSPNTIARFVSSASSNPYGEEHTLWGERLFQYLLETETPEKLHKKINAVAQAAGKLLNTDAKKLGSQLRMNRIVYMVSRVENTEEANAVLEVTENLFAINKKAGKQRIEMDAIAAIAPRVKTSEHAKSAALLTEFFLDLTKKAGNGMKLHPGAMTEYATYAKNLEEAGLVKETASRLFSINQKSKKPHLNVADLIDLSYYVKEPEKSAARINAFSSLANFAEANKLALGKKRIRELVFNHIYPEQVEAKVDFARSISELYRQRQISPKELDEMVTFSLFIITPDEAKKAKEVVKTGAFLHSPNKSDFLMEKLGMTARGNAFLKLIPNSVPFEQNAPKHEFARAITGLYNRLRISSDELDRMIEFLPSIQTHEDAEVAKKIFETREFLTSPDKHNFLAKKFEEMATQST